MTKYTGTHETLNMVINYIRTSPKMVGALGFCPQYVEEGNYEWEMQYSNSVQGGNAPIVFKWKSC